MGTREGFPAREAIGAVLACSILFRLPSASRTLGTRDKVLAKSASLVLLVCGTGMLVITLHEKRLDKGLEPTSTSQEMDVWMIVLDEPPEKGRNSYRAGSEAWMGAGDGKFEYKGRCLAYLRPGEGMPVPPTGTRILTSQTPEPILFKGNPGGFDAHTHYRRQGLPTSVFLDLDRCVILGGIERKNVMAWVYESRDRILGILQRYIRHPEALGIAEALLIGYRGHLDRSVADAYAGTGVIHVIAISGLHIGMIYAIAMGLAGMILGKTAAGRYRPLAVIPLLWAFAMMTGCSASVMRSVCMFTVIGVGTSLLGRRGRPLNTLLATAFLLLAFRPHWIHDIGFQLSFTAVAGIMLLYPGIRASAAFDNRAAALLWDSIALTLSAQLLTTPLILFHFGRFPLLFLFTNLVAVPLSSLILLAELLLCAVSPFPATAEWMGSAIESAILWMNRYVADMDGIPHSSLEGVHINALSTLCLYAIIAASHMALANRSTANSLRAIASVCLFSLSVAWESMARQRQELLVIPHIKGKSQVMFVDGLRGTRLLSDTSGEEDLGSVMQWKNMASHYRIRESETIGTDSAPVIAFDWKGRRMLRLGKGAPKRPDPMNRRPDLILLSENTDADPVAWLQATGCTTWVADGSNSLWKIQKWKTLCAGLPLRFHSTSQKGAFIMNE